MQHIYSNCMLFLQYFVKISEMSSNLVENLHIINKTCKIIEFVKEIFIFVNIRDILAQMVIHLFIRYNSYVLHAKDHLEHYIFQNFRFFSNLPIKKITNVLVLFFVSKCCKSRFLF